MKYHLLNSNRFLFFLLTLLICAPCFSAKPPYEGLPLYYWQQKEFVNFGDYMSLRLVERMVNGPVEVFKRWPPSKRKKLLAIGSLLSFAESGDAIWGTGVNGKLPDKKEYNFTFLDVRAVRGPLTRNFLLTNFNISSPEIYGDPALLLPYLFPEFKKMENPTYDYIVIVHFKELNLFPKTDDGHIVHATDPWDYVVKRILDSKFVISSSLHGIVVAEAYGIPARLLRTTEIEPLLKFQDYYLGTNRSDFQYATSIEEALLMGGEPKMRCDLEALYNAFPFEYWPNAKITKPIFTKNE